MASTRLPEGLEFPIISERSVISPGASGAIHAIAISVRVYGSYVVEQQAASVSGNISTNAVLIPSVNSWPYNLVRILLLSSRQPFLTRQKLELLVKKHGALIVRWLLRRWQSIVLTRMLQFTSCVH